MDAVDTSRSAAVAPARARGRALLPPSTLALAATVAPGLLAAALQTFRILRPGGLLSGGSYDTSVYLGSAIRMVHGVLPYRDFVELQPPGLPLVLSPFALVSFLAGSRGALMALSAAQPLLAAANVVLAGRLVHHRGWPTVLAVGLLVALSPGMYAALMDGQLEPLIDLLSLAALLVAFRGDRLAAGRPMAVAGVLWGLATSILLAAAIPLAAMALLCAGRPRRRLLPLAAGAAAGFAVTFLPFLASARGGLVGDTLLTALHRASGSTRTALSTRVADIGFYGAHDTVGAIVLSALVLVAILGLALPRRRLSPLEGFALASTVLMGAAQLAVTRYYPHYAAMLIPYLALLAVLASGRLVFLAGGGRRPGRWRPWLAGALATAVAMAAIVPALERYESSRWVNIAPNVDAVIPRGGCAVAEHVQDLIESDRFLSTRPGCTDFVDSYGTTLVHQAPHDFVESYTDILEHADYVVTDTSLRVWFEAPWDGPVRTFISENFSPVRSGPLVIWVRRPRAAIVPATETMWRP
jgi:alpha-1,2-mannosyltransferase